MFVNMPVYTAIMENMTHSNATVANLLTNFTPTYTMQPFINGKKREWNEYTWCLEGCCNWQSSTMYFNRHCRSPIMINRHVPYTRKLLNMAS